jgi:hypothetical protein
MAYIIGVKIRPTLLIEACGDSSGPEDALTWIGDASAFERSRKAADACAWSHLAGQLRCERLSTP